MIGSFDAKIPPGPLAQKWRNHLDHSRLVSPNNRRKFEIIVVGSGLAYSDGFPMSIEGSAPSLFHNLFIRMAT